MDLIDNVFEGSIKSTAKNVSKNIVTRLNSNLLLNWGDYKKDLSIFTKAGDTYLTKGIFVKHEVEKDKSYEHFDGIKKELDMRSFEFSSLFGCLVANIEKTSFSEAKSIHVKGIRDGVLALYDNRKDVKCDLKKMNYILRLCFIIFVPKSDVI